ncbi:MAG: alpha/beta fold hydrolase, partial [Candidatus Methylumidiphilus sp.]
VYGHLFGPAMRANPGVALALLTVSIPPADQAILAQDGVKPVVCDSIGEALRAGMRGALRDFHLYAHPWGFDLGDITLPVVIWHGEDDATVPISHSRFLADRLPSATLHTVAGEGHFSLPIGQADTILADLIHSIPHTADNNT